MANLPYESVESRNEANIPDKRLADTGINLKEPFNFPSCFK